MARVLAIGNKAYSSWSLRPWLYLKVKGIDFDEVRIPLYVDGSKSRILAHSPAGKVPALRIDDLIVWDSLAILETLAELYPHLKPWPTQPDDRALARSISAEMHAGFQTLRGTLFFNCRRRIVFRDIDEALRSDIDRVCAIWRQCRSAHRGAGPFLFGDFTIADAMYAPVVSRFETYGIEVGVTEREYMDAILGLPAMRAWIESAHQESEVIDRFERRAD
ncbi:MAG: glutathione S-transferase family protein [Gammaproteobacteria bacterium]|nr:glutathione S-transferase family protein [Gammaproteobacteria bacterium]